MPTPRGWLVAALGLGLALAGRGFGSQSLIQLGYAFIVVVVVALIVVRLRKHELIVSRWVSPERARLGEKVAATVRIDNRGRGAAPLLLAEDRVPAGLSGKARFAVHGIERGGYREASYAIKPARRSRYELGPLAVSVVDPFGLARMLSVSSETSTFLVHPRIHKLSLPRDQLERRSMSPATVRTPSVSSGEEFYTLREYSEGDDLRKIHWPATAKRGRYMIRQEETPWHTRATILLDDGAASHDAGGSGSSFERAVEVAASLVDLYHRSGYSYRLLCTSEQEVPAGRGAEQRNRCLDLLATIEPQERGPRGEALRMRLAEMNLQTSPEAALMVAGGSVDPATAALLGHLSRRFRQAALVSVPAHRYGSHSTKARWDAESELVEATRLLARSSIRCLVLGPDDPLDSGWTALWSAQPKGVSNRWAQRPELV